MHFEGLSGAINVRTGVIFGMRLFAGSPEEKKNDVTPAKPAAPAKPVAVTKAAAPDKAKIVAAITAAIIEFTGSQNFRILSVQPETSSGVPGDHWTSRWKTAGMLGLNSNRLNRKWH